VTPVFTTIGGPDSLIFDGNNNIIYTNLTSLHQVREYNTTTNTDSLIAGNFNDPADLVLEPGGQTILMSDFLSGQIFRINLTTHAVSTLGTYGGNPQGTAYDSTGRLFANLGTRTGGATSFVAQLNPVTGAVLAVSANLVSLDGLTFDPFSGKLYGASLNGNGIYQIDPNTLAATVLPNSAGPAFDGITTDGAGNLYIANSNTRIYQYNLATSTLTAQTFVSGLDDLAPVFGAGAPTPLPSSFLGGLVLLGIFGLIWKLRGRRSNADR
jgi:sugar lactone lactonase YvrE